MEFRTLRLFSVAAVLVLLASATFAQSETISSAIGDRYIISAKAGGVNFVEGTVTVTNAAGKSSRLLKGDSVEVGERVSTGADGRVEILLNPGSYIRLGNSSAFQFETTSLDDLKLRISAGSAVFEVFADNDFVVQVRTPSARFDLVQSGVYTVEALPGAESIAVWKGRAIVNGRTDNPLKPGRGAIVNGTQVAVAKFDRDQRNPLEEWSRSRAKELAKISATLRPRDLREPLWNSYRGGRWDMWGSFGLWVYDPMRGSYCFLPFGRGWSSPYGYGYGYDIWSYRLPRVIYYPPATGGTPGGGTTAPPTTTPQTGPIYDRRNTVPPFQRVNNPPGGGTSNGGYNGPVDRKSPDYSPRVYDRPVYSPPMSAPTSSGGRGSGKTPDN